GAISPRIIVPPGMRATVYRPSDAGIDARIIIAHQFFGCAPTFAFERSGGVDTQKYDIGRLVVDTGAVVDATIQSEATDAARTTNGIDLAIGQPCTTIDVSFIQISNVATDADVVDTAPNPLTVYCNLVAHGP